MANRITVPRAILIASLCGCTALAGCVAAIVPVATGALAGRRALQHRGHGQADAPASAPRPTPPAAPARRTAPPPSPAMPPPAPEPTPPAVPPPAEPAKPIAPPIAATTWYDVVRYAGHEAAAKPGRARSSVLPLAKDGSYPACGALPLAAVVAAGSVGPGDYLNVGALSTIGLEVVFTAGPAGLTPSQMLGLAKQNVPPPVAGTTLFVSPPGSEGAARQAIVRQYCVVALVGAHPADFPYAALPGAPRSHAGWFLVAPSKGRPSRATPPRPRIKAGR